MRPLPRRPAGSKGCGTTGRSRRSSGFAQSGPRSCVCPVEFWRRSEASRRWPSRGAVTFALWQHGGKEPAKELYTTDNRQTPDGLNNLPHDYSGLPKQIPQLGPPLPGDLGKPILNAGAPTPGMAGPATAPGSPDPEVQRQAQERQRRAQELQAVRTSRLFASEGQAAAPPASSAISILPAASLLGPTASGAIVAGASQPAETDHKLAFLNAPADRRTSSVDQVQAPANQSVLQAGAVIPAALLTGLRSDLPGQITAQVTEAVYDSPTGRILLIPQGARLIGQYDAQVAFGQSRALLVWNRIVMPNGRSIVLERQPGADPQGYAGLQDRVDNHWGCAVQGRAALDHPVGGFGGRDVKRPEQPHRRDPARRV